MSPRKPAQDAQDGPVEPRTRRRSPGMARALERTLQALTLTPADDAAVALARALARAIDADDRLGMTLSDLSSKLLAVLSALGATPAARKAIKDTATEGGDERDRGNPVADFRARAAGRAAR